MKRILLIISIAFCFTMLTQAAVSKTVTLYSAGQLKANLTVTELTTVTNLIVNGVIDARDFYTMKNLMTSLTDIDLSNTVVEAFSGTGGTLYGYDEKYLADEIPISAFDSRVVSIILPNSIVGLSSYAVEATKITSITIPGKVTYIGNNAFKNCSSLKSVSLPSSLKSIGEYAFNNCGLTSVSMPNSVTSVENFAFMECSSLSSVQLSQSLTIIHAAVFKKCFALTSIDIPSSVKTIEASAFENCAYLTSVTLHEGLQTIGNSAFYYCLKLGSIALPSTLININISAFRDCDLTSISIPASVTTIGARAFENNDKITAIYAFGSTPVDLSTSTDVFKNVNHSTCNVYVLPGKSTTYKSATEWKDFTNIIDKSYTLSVSTSTINANAASSTTNSAVTSNTYWLASSNKEWIILEDSTGYGNATFKIKVAANTDTIARSGQVLITGIGATSKQITVNQAASTVSLLSVSTPIINFNDYATLTDTLKITANIAWKVTSDAPWVTMNKTSGTGNDFVLVTAAANALQTYRTATLTLKGYNVPTVKTIVAQGQYPTLAVSAGGLSASISDAEKESISELTITGTLDARDFQFMRDSIRNLSVLNISGAQIVAYTGTQGTVSGSNTYDANIIPNYAFYNNSTSKGKTSLTYVILPTSAISLGSFSFQSCTNLASIDLPEGLKTVGTASFKFCSGLQEIYFPSTVNSIGSSSFFGCTNLTELIIPNGVTSINSYTFSGCRNINKLYIPSTVTTISSYAFRDCSNLSEMHVYPVTPVNISASTDVLSGVDRYHCKLYVPSASLSAYRTADIWKEFLKIGSIPSPTISVNTSSISATAVSTTKNIIVTSNTYGFISSNQPWVKLQQKSYGGNNTIYFEVETNPSFAARTATITITAEGASSKQVTVTQAAATPTLAVSNATLTYDAAGSSISVSVTSNTTWAASSNAAWLTISASTGSGNLSLVCTASANANAASRTAKITLSATGVSTKYINITQTGATPTLSVTYADNSFDAAGGNLTMNVASNASWSASTGASWLTVSPGSGSGNGTISVHASANTNITSRTTTLIVYAYSTAYQEITITQEAAAPSVSLSSTSLTIIAGGDAKEVYVTSNTSWIATSDQSWLTLDMASRTGNGIFLCFAAANPNASSRIATVTITAPGVADKILTITQSPANQTLSVSESVLNFESDGGSVTFQINSNTSWTITSDQSWLSNSTPSGADNATITLTANANTTSGARSAVVTISAAGQTDKNITVTQDAAGLNLNLSETSLDYSATGGTNSINITSNISWSVSSDVSWITVSSASGSNDASIEITCAANTEQNTRTGIIIISAEGIADRTVTITQNGSDVVAVNEYDGNSISLYPNPTNSMLYYKLNNIKVDRISILDLTGKILVDEISMSQRGFIDLSSFENGIYFIRISKENSIWVERIVKN